MKIIFFGSSQSSIKVLSALLTGGYDIAACVTKAYSPIQSFATGAKLKVLTPENLSSDFIFYLKQLKPEMGVVFIYGKIIPKALIDAFPKGIVGVHPSLLPKYRGPSPIVQAILNGDTETGVTLYLLDEKVDHGPILAQNQVAIDAKDTNFTLLEKCAETSAALIEEVLPKYTKGEISPQPQEEKYATQAPMLSKESGKIRWEDPPQKIERMVRAYFPWPGAWTTLGELIQSHGGDISKRKGLEKRIRILRAHLDEGGLAIDELQIEGKSPIPWKQFAAGYLWISY